MDEVIEFIAVDGTGDKVIFTNGAGKYHEAKGVIYLLASHLKPNDYDVSSFWKRVTKIKYQRGMKVRFIGDILTDPVHSNQTTRPYIERGYCYFEYFESEVDDTLNCSSNIGAQLHKYGLVGVNTEFDLRGFSFYCRAEYIEPFELNPTEPKTCAHKWVNAGFTSNTMCCYHCGMDKP